jgi:hypothetical protein
MQLFFCPTNAIEGLEKEAGLLITELGQGSSLLIRPSHITRYTLIPDGFTLQASDLVYRVIQHLVKGQKTDRKKLTKVLK